MSDAGPVHRPRPTAPTSTLVADPTAAEVAAHARSARDRAVAEYMRRVSRSRRARTRESAPAGAYNGTAGPCGGWEGLVGRYNWDVTTACRILMCESGGNPNARNPRSSATGLFQVLGGPTDPEANVALAYSMYRRSGWRPWVCR